MQFFQSIYSLIQKDARYYQIISLSSFLCVGIMLLGWHADALKYIMIFGTCILTQYVFARLNNQSIDTLKSAMITALGLCLLFKANQPILYVCVAFIAIAGKYIVRSQEKHYINPANFGIILTILLFGNAWISPGQWGSQLYLMLLVAIAGLLVLNKVSRLDTGLVFLFTYLGLEFYLNILFKGWPLDFFLHQSCNGALLLFSFFMITDPVSSPNHAGARMLWAMSIAVLSYYLSTYYFINGAPLWSLFVLAPFTYILDKLFPSKRFYWNDIPNSFTLTPIINKIKIMSLNTKKLASILALVCISTTAWAFCGFYVAKTDAKLFNKASQVIMVRNGNKTTITMSNDYQGDFNDFAMVVPVPEVLKRDQIRVVDQLLFDQLDAYSGPRLVEYYDQNPCYDDRLYDIVMSPKSIPADMEGINKNKNIKEDKYKVKIEAKYTVGEYDILLLSAEESTGLESWLNDNGYKIPVGAQEVLQPYIKSNMKFFVVKVNMDEAESMSSNLLRPLQINFSSPKFMLPIRLGMANADGEFQDLIVYAFSQKGRVETTNYRTIYTPSNKNVPLFVKDKFEKFYKSLFDNTYNDEKNVSYLEYAWDISSTNYMHCDPCSSSPPDYKQLADAGVDWVRAGQDGYSSANYSGQVHFTRLHIRYDRKHFPQDLVFQETSNKSNYQCRYILQHPVTGVDCDEAYTYYKGVYERRKKELYQLAELTGWDIDKYKYYTQEYKELMIDHAPADKRKGLLQEEKEDWMILKASMLDISDSNSMINKLLTILLLPVLITGVMIYIHKYK